MKKYFILILCILPIFSFSGCPDGCRDCVDQYIVEYSLSGKLKTGTYFAIAELCSSPAITLSIYDYGNNPAQPLVSVPFPFTNPLTGYCAKKDDEKFVSLIKVNELEKFFVAKILTFQLAWTSSRMFPFVRGLDFSQSAIHCIKLQFVPEPPEVEFIKPCDGIKITIPLAIQKSLLTNQPIFLGDCPC